MNKTLVSMVALAALLGGVAVTAMQVSAQDTTAAITESEAQKIAEAKIGGTADSVASEREHGQLVYEVQVGGQEVEISAADGSILEIEPADSDFELFDFDD